MCLFETRVLAKRKIKHSCNMCAKKDNNYYTSTCRLDKENRGEKGFGGKSLILERIPTLSHTKAKKMMKVKCFHKVIVSSIQCVHSVWKLYRCHDFVFNPKLFYSSQIYTIYAQSQYTLGCTCCTQVPIVVKQFRVHPHTPTPYRITSKTWKLGFACHREKSIASFFFSEAKCKVESVM